MNLFSQQNFLRGLNTRIDPSKLSDGYYPRLINGRVTSNGVKPVKKHVKSSVPSGKKQGLYAFGKYLLLFSNGIAWWKDVSTDASWTAIAGWTAMSTTADRIYAELIPVSYFQGSISYTDDKVGEAVVTSVPGIAAPTPQQVFITDGVNQPRILNLDGSWRETNGNYSAWTKENPEYVPIGILPRKSGSKLYMVDPVTKSKIYHSVTGRFLDFVINRDKDGNAGGDEQTTFKSVDFNETTSLSALPEGGLLVSTLYRTYAVALDYNRALFAEPYLQEDPIFPTGAINERSTADINGDVALVTQHGIVSFNTVSQTQTESNNFPLGAPIADILIQPQTGTAAINYDTYALFSVDTIYGKAVLVYDNTLEAFVSIDLNFGEVIDFALVKYQGARRLFFLNTDNDVYEAYASDDYAVCRIYLGDYSILSSQSYHRPGIVFVQFDELTADTAVQLTLYSDGEITFKQTRTITGSSYPDSTPRALPRDNHSNGGGVGFNLENPPYCLKSGYYIEWQTAAELLSVIVDGDVMSLDSFKGNLGIAQDTNFVLTAFADNAFGAELAGSGAWELVAGLTIGDWYSIVGTAHLGSRTIANTIFQAKTTSINVNGSLRACGDVKTVYDLMVNDNPTKILGAGDHSMSDGSADDVQRILTVVNKSRVLWTPGNHDNDTDNGKWFHQAVPTELYYKSTIGNCSVFFVNSGYNTAGSILVPNTVSSAQAQWLKAGLEASTSQFNVVVFHHPPYTDDSSYYPGYSDLRWPFSSWGADLIITGHAHLYQRFTVNNIPYVVLGPAGSAVRSRSVGQNNADVYDSHPGYLRLNVDPFNILCEWVGKDRRVYDAFAIQA